jgi:hypothetical protein
MLASRRAAPTAELTAAAVVAPADAGVRDADVPVESGRTASTLAELAAVVAVVAPAGAGVRDADVPVGFGSTVSTPAAVQLKVLTLQASLGLPFSHQKVLNLPGQG